MEWIKCTDRLPIFDEGLRVLVHTAEHDFNGEQFFDVLATDLYDGLNGEPKSEVCAVATHWANRPHLAL